MKLAQLSNPQWLAAIHCATVLTSCSPHRDADRARFRAARDELTALLPAGTDVRDIITQATHAVMRDNIAAVIEAQPELIGARH